MLFRFLTVIVNKDKYKKLKKLIREDFLNIVFFFKNLIKYYFIIYLIILNFLDILFFIFYLFIIFFEE